MTVDTDDVAPPVAAGAGTVEWPGDGERPGGDGGGRDGRDWRSRRRRRRRWLRGAMVTVLVTLFGTELVVGWPSLNAAMSQLRAPHPGWLALALVAETTAMGAYARMQRCLLRSAGVRVSIVRHVALAYAAHSLSVTLPGGPAFSTRLNYRQMRRFGATPAVASWCITLSGILSATALAAVTAAGAILADRTPRWHTLAALAVTTVLITTGLRRLARCPESIEPVTGVVLTVVNRLRRRPAGHGTDRVRGFLDQWRTTRLRPAHALGAVVYALLNWVLDAVCLWLCFRAVDGGTIGASQLLLAFCAGMAAGTITVVPGGLGIIDNALILGLAASGVATATAIATVVLYRIISLGFIISIGWIWYLAMRWGTRAGP